MRRALVGLVVVLALAGCSGNEPAPRPEPPPPPPRKSRLHRYAFQAEAPSNREVGTPLPGEDAELTAPDGRVVRISDYRGRPLILVFNRGFAGFVCPYCATYTAQLAARYQEIRALGGEVLLVYPTRDADEARVLEFADAVNEILEEEGGDALPFPVFLDRGLAATVRFNLTGDITRPSTFVLDRAGVLRYAYVGSAPDERPAVDRVVEELRAVAGGGS
ncbi:MAG: peroxiredoxin family protein [Planctomycetes bacterium]|nr:peroxiredoxin family protein [Planctomycetota bacterium]